MKIITQPAVHVLAEPAFYAHPQYQLPRDGTEAERLIATGGKVCYDTYGVDGNPVKRHVGNLVAQGHLAVVEHVHVSVFIEGISRGCSHEIVRHRLFNYSQRSTRYTDEQDAAIVLVPTYADLWERQLRGDLLDDIEHRIVSGAVDNARRDLAAYSAQVAWLEEWNPEGLSGKDLRKWARGNARQALPHALETRMVMTGNLRAWRHFLLMRTSRHAEGEIRRLAAAVFAVLEETAPAVFADLVRADVRGLLELAEPVAVTRG